MIVKIQSKRILTEAQLELLYVEAKKKRLQEGKKTETAVDILQLVLDVIGLSPDPVLGTAADGINALISVARGDALGAFFSIISLIPVVGDMIGKSAKLARYIVKLKPFIEIFRKGSKFGKIGKALNITGAAVSALTTLQAALSRYAPEIKKLLVSIKTGNLNDIEEITNIKFPKLVRDDIEKALKEVGPTMDLDDQYKFMNFMGNLDPKQPATEEKTVKITKTKLKRIIKEEISRILKESDAPGLGHTVGDDPSTQARADGAAEYRYEFPISPPEPCDNNEPCDNGQICVNGKCHRNPDHVSKQDFWYDYKDGAYWEDWEEGYNNMQEMDEYTRYQDSDEYER